MTLNELTAKHVDEYANLLKTQDKEQQRLYQKHMQEIQAKGQSIELAQNQRSAIHNLEKIHSQQRDFIGLNHKKEYENFVNTEALKKPHEDYQIEQDRKALNAQRAEERENYKNNFEESRRKERETLLEKIKNTWSKDRDKDRER
jgi:hypothetical protein